MVFGILVLTGLAANTQKQGECQYDFDLPYVYNFFFSFSTIIFPRFGTNCSIKSQYSSTALK